MDELTLGIRAFQKSLYEEAHALLEPLAEQGVLRAQMIVARLYYAGNGVEKDFDKYVYWLQAAADGGDKAAKSQIKRITNKDAGT
jgi:TPR repeat protein